MRKFLGECRDHLARRRGGECRPQEGCQRNQGAPSVKSPSQTVGELSMRRIDSRDTRGAIAPKDWRDLSVPKTQGRCRRTAEQRDELAPFHVWMAPAWQEIIWRAAQRSLAVMCPACWCSPGGLLARMGSANRVLIIRTGSMSR